MPKTKERQKHNGQSSAPKSFDTWFHGEIAELNARLERLESSPPQRRSIAAKPRPRQPLERRKRRKTKPSAATAAAAVVPAPSSEPIASSAEPASAVNAQPAPAPPAPSPLPTGADLSDPKNFGLMPPTADLLRGTASEDEYRQRLSRHIAFATKVLHTSRVPAAVWREWRAFEKAAHERLRELASRATEAV